MAILIITFGSLIAVSIAYWAILRDEKKKDNYPGAWTVDISKEDLRMLRQLRDVEPSQAALDAYRKFRSQQEKD